MASNAEMRRLILHAADRLAEESDQALLVKAIGDASGLGDTSARVRMAQQLRSVTAAMALAETTLRMVAACLVDDEVPESSLVLERDARGRFVKPPVAQAGGTS